MASPQPRIAVVTYPGSQDDRDALWALSALDAEAVPVWHEERELPDLDAVVLPGGFSYGDYLRCGAIARFSPATAAVCEFAEAGGLVLGICNGFQILCEAGLLPGVLLRNESLRFVCRDVPLVVERDDLPFTSRCTVGQTITIPVKHAGGGWGGGAAPGRRGPPGGEDKAPQRSPSRVRERRHARGDPPLTRLLPNRHFLEQLGPPPWCCRLRCSLRRHGSDATPE